MTKSEDNKFETRIPMFNGTPKYDFGLCSFRVEVAHKSREMRAALDSDSVERRVDPQARAIIIVPMAVIPWRLIKDCQST